MKQTFLLMFREDSDYSNKENFKEESDFEHYIKSFINISKLNFKAFKKSIKYFFIHIKMPTQYY